MRITYVSHIRFPTEKAHGLQVANVCNAMGQLGHEVTLLIPTIWNAIKKDAFAYYKLPASFTIKKLKHFDALKSKLVPGFLGFAVSMFFYGGKLRKYLRITESDLLYARSPLLLGAMLSSGTPVILELHTIPKRMRGRFVSQCNQCKLVVCLTHAMKKELSQMGVDEKLMIVEGDAVNLDSFKNLPSSDESAHHMDLPADIPVVGYVGSLVTFNNLKKGVDDILDALLSFKKRNIKMFGWIVGGPPSWQDKYRRLASTKTLTVDDIQFHDPIASARVPEALNACDVLVYPAPDSKHPYFQRDTSPLKLFEYLASGTPIVCADIPPVHDIVSKETVKFCHPGSGKSLAGAILEVLEKKGEANKRAKEGLKLVKEHTWKKRMKRVLEAL